MDRDTPAGSANAPRAEQGRRDEDEAPPRGGDAVAIPVRAPSTPHTGAPRCRTPRSRLSSTMVRCGARSTRMSRARGPRSIAWPAGVALDEVTDALQRDGVAQFAAAFDDLNTTIAAKREEMLSRHW